MIIAESFTCTPFVDGAKTMATCDIPTSWLDYLGPLATGLAALTAIITLVALLMDSRRRSRPYIEAKLEAGFWGDGAADLIIQNFGTTPARDIVVKCKELDKATTDMAKALRDYFAKHRILRPGERIRLIWNYQPEGTVLEDGSPIAKGTDIPALTTLNITYRRQKLNGKPAEFFEPYKETFHLDASFKSVAPVIVGLPNPKDKAITEDHKDIRKGFELIARQIGELRR